MVSLDVQGTTIQFVGLMERPTQMSVCSAFLTGSHLIDILTFLSLYASKIFTLTSHLTDRLLALGHLHSVELQF